MEKVLVVVAIMLSLAACSTLDPQRALHRGNVLLSGGGSDIDADAALLRIQNQDKYLQLFALEAGINMTEANSQSIPPQGGSAQNSATYTPPGFGKLKSTDWSEITNAGVVELTSQCEDYLHALWELNRARQATNTEINSAGSLVAAILGATQASSPAIAITASAFGFAAATSENLYSSLLYQLDQSSVDALVHNSQLTVKQAIQSSESSNTIASRADAVGALMQYINVCLPQTIEANVNAAVKNAVTSPGNTTPPEPGGAAPPLSKSSPPPAGALSPTNVQVSAPQTAAQQNPPNKSSN